MRRARLFRFAFVTLAHVAMLALPAIVLSVSVLVDALQPAEAGESRPGPPVFGVSDDGIWPDLDGEVRLRVPSWVSADGTSVLVDEMRETLTLVFDGTPVKTYPVRFDATPGETWRVVKALRSPALGPIALRTADAAELRAHLGKAPSVTTLAAGRHAKGDRDGDGIPDQVDIVVGARKTVLNGASYEGGYEKLDFPGGDVARTKGVCTDVLVRALRNAGLDLQAALQKDIRARRKAYGRRVKRPDPNIDHRRVKTLIVWFRKHWKRLGTTVDPARPQDWLPGDVVFLDTFPNRRGPDHVGVLSDRLNADGLPLVVNNWTTGHRTAEMDLLGWIPVTDHVRIR